MVNFIIDLRQKSQYFRYFFIYRVMSNKKIWSKDQEQNLFTLHQSVGNQWKHIAIELNIDQNSIKNKFYSTLRTGVRKINDYLQRKKKSNRKKYNAIKTIQKIFISKLMAVLDESYDKYEVKPLAFQLALDIKTTLITIAKSEVQYYNSNQETFKMQELAEKIFSFNKNCKRRKGNTRGHSKRISIQVKEGEQFVEIQKIKQENWIRKPIFPAFNVRQQQAIQFLKTIPIMQKKIINSCFQQYQDQFNFKGNAQSEREVENQLSISQFTVKTPNPFKNNPCQICYRKSFQLEQISLEAPSGLNTNNTQSQFPESLIKSSEIKRQIDEECNKSLRKTKHLICQSCVFQNQDQFQNKKDFAKLYSFAIPPCKPSPKLSN